MQLKNLTPSDLTLDDLTEEEWDTLVFIPEQKARFKAQKAFVVRGGKKVKVQVRRKAGVLSAKQKAALRKARRKAQTGIAKLKRKKSLKVRKRLGLKKIKGGVRGGARRTN